MRRDTQLGPKALSADTCILVEAKYRREGFVASGVSDGPTVLTRIDQTIANLPPKSTLDIDQLDSTDVGRPSTIKFPAPSQKMGAADLRHQVP